jgi:hypothetical protein
MNGDDMDNKLNTTVRRGFWLVLIFGFAAHFFYEWSGQNFLAGLFFPVNESTWEHMKLIFIPMFLWTIFLAFRFPESRDCVISGFLAGLLLGTAAIPVLFYTYSGILGKNVMVLDILVYIICMMTAFYTGWRMTKSCRLKPYTRLLEIIVYLILLCFVIFSVHPPKLGVFHPPAA